jgi:hypothetical protein
MMPTDRTTIARARQLAGLDGADALLEHTGETDYARAYASAFGEAQHLLAVLAVMAGRLQADVSRLRNDRARYRVQLSLPRDADDQEALREAGTP